MLFFVTVILMNLMIAIISSKYESALENLAKRELAAMIEIIVELERLIWAFTFCCRSVDESRETKFLGYAKYEEEDENSI